MNVAHILTERARSCGDRPAIIEGFGSRNRTLTFAELESAAARAAARLWESGLRPGDSVLVLVPMSAELYIGLIATFRLGLVAMFLDPGAGRKHIESCCALHPPSALIASPQAHWLRFISSALRRIPIKFSTGKPVFRARPLLGRFHGLLRTSDDLELTQRSVAVHGCEFGRRLAARTFVERDARRTRRRDAWATRRFTESPLFLTDLLTGHEPGSAGIPAGEITGGAGKDAGAPRFMGSFDLQLGTRIVGREPPTNRSADAHIRESTHNSDGNADVGIRAPTGRFIESARLIERSRIQACDAGTPALIRFTSGSTGQPKCAVRTHGFLLEQQRVIEKSLRLVAGDVDLATLPIFVLANLASGVTSVIPQADLRAPGAIDPGPVVRQIRALSPQRVSASPAFLERLADYCSQTSQRLTSFRAVFAGGAPVFPHLLDKFHGMSPAANIVAVYGSTEAEPIAQVRRDEISNADREAMSNGGGLLAGMPDPAIRVRILGERGRERISGLAAHDFEVGCQRPGEPGEIVVSGPHIQPGYLHGLGDQETKVQINGTTWHQTGDAGYVDALGRLWLLGRSCARIRDERGTLYPFQVECAAYRDREVRRAALVEHEGQRVLVVQSRNGVSLSSLKASLAWADIRRVKLVRRIPLDKRHNAKIDYVALRRIL